MRKILTLILLFVSLTTFGQRFPFANSAHLSMGTNQISNGTFDDDSDWEKTSGWTISAGVATYDGVDSYQSIYQTNDNMTTPIVGSTDYRLEFDVSNAASSMRIRVRSALSEWDIEAADDYANGTHIVDFTSPSDVGTYGGIRLMAYNTGDSGDIDNVTLKTR